MPDRTVPTDTGELTGYAVTAAELRRIADALDTLPPIDKPPWVTMSFLPEHTVEAVDAVALAVLGKPGETQKINGEWYHLVRRDDPKTNVHVTVQTSITGPPDERDVELERLRAELAALKSAEYGHDRIDHGDAATPVPATVDGHPEFTGRAPVPEPDCGWMTPSGPCHLVRDHPLFPFGPREDSGHISKASSEANRARLAEPDAAAGS